MSPAPNGLIRCTGHRRPAEQRGRRVCEGGNDLEQESAIFALRGGAVV